MRKLLSSVEGLWRCAFKLSHLKIVDFPHPRGPVTITGSGPATLSSHGHDSAKISTSNRSSAMCSADMYSNGDCRVNECGNRGEAARVEARSNCRTICFGSRRAMLG